MKAAPAANAIELKSEKSAKAKRILVGVDVHLRGYQAARKIDSGVIRVRATVFRGNGAGSAAHYFVGAGAWGTEQSDKGRALSFHG